MNVFKSFIWESILSDIRTVAGNLFYCEESVHVAVQPGLCLTLYDTPKTGFLATRLIVFSISHDI